MIITIGTYLLSCVDQAAFDDNLKFLIIMLK